MPATTDVSANAAALSAHAAQWLVRRLEASAGKAAVALSGGSTPKALYQHLAVTPLRDRVPWERVHWFFGDERFVPHDDKDSNFRMAREAFLSRVPAPPESVHPIPGTGTAAAAADSYAGELKAFYGADVLDPGRPLFAVVLLGLGEDGHTAALFPGTAALDERARWAVPNRPSDAPHERITLTYPVLNSTEAAAFLIAGAGKRAMLSEVRSPTSDKPAARMARMLGDRLTWMVDEAALG